MEVVGVRLVTLNFIAWNFKGVSFSELIKGVLYGKGLAYTQGW